MYDLNEIKEFFSNYPREESLTLWELSKPVSELVDTLAQDAIKEYMEKSNITDHYNYPYNVKGDAEYLEVLSKFLTKCYKRPVESSSLLGTYGATHGYNMILEHFFRKDDYIFFEDLSFNRAIIAANHKDTNVVAVDCDDEGINIQLLEEQLKCCRAKSQHVATEKKPYWAMLYLLTQFHNPKGICYTEERCKAVLELARKYDVLIFTDDVYTLFSFSDKNNKIGDIIGAYDKCNWSSGKGNAVSNSSFTKLLFPSLRVGWLEMSPWMMGEITKRADITGINGYNAWNQGVATAMLKNKNFDKYFETLLNMYKDQLYAASEFLEEHLPKEVTFKRPSGSFFLWVKLPTNCKSTELLALCKEYNVRFNPGFRYCTSPNDVRYENYFRLSISNLPIEELKMALYVICEQSKVLINDRKQIN